MFGVDHSLPGACIRITPTPSWACRASLRGSLAACVLSPVNTRPLAGEGREGRLVVPCTLARCRRGCRRSPPLLLERHVVVWVESFWRLADDEDVPFQTRIRTERAFVDLAEQPGPKWIT